MSNIPANWKPIGMGRSAVAFSAEDAAGNRRVHKVFGVGGAAKLVQFILTGAPNAYSWSSDALAAAAARREILVRLLRFWFGDRVRVPRLLDAGWNPAMQANELCVELIDGSHLPLHYRHASHDSDPFAELTDRVMRPLQDRLIESGFDGLVWQAGLGNPVAGGNFMLERIAGPHRAWVWIDLESGVPALIPLNPLSLVFFYLPKSIRHGRPLFDDVDIGKLRKYLADHGAVLGACLSRTEMTALHRAVDELDTRQSAWKSMTRVARGVTYYRAVGKISDGESRWYTNHPWRWHLRLVRDGSRNVAQAIVATARGVASWLKSVNLIRVASDAHRLVSSHRFRSHLARKYLIARIREWRKRRFVTSTAARRLRSELRRERDGGYIADFGVHLGIKPIIKSLQWLLLPLLYGLGVLAGPVVLLGLAAGGAIGRTVYTAGRCLQLCARGRRPPLVALAIGVLPGVGNFAFPLQLLFDASRHDARVPQFVLYDTLANIGRSVPIWGGQDSLLEAYFNRLPLILRRLATARHTRRLVATTARKETP